MNPTMPSHPIHDLESAFLAGRLVMAKDLLDEARVHRTPSLTQIRRLQKIHDDLVLELNDRVTTTLQREGVAMRREPFNLTIQRKPLALHAEFARA
jgi:hypothetical protein